MEKSEFFFSNSGGEYSMTQNSASIKEKIKNFNYIKMEASTRKKRILSKLKDR